MSRVLLLCFVWSWWHCGGEGNIQGGRIYSDRYRGVLAYKTTKMISNHSGES